MPERPPRFPNKLLIFGILFLVLGLVMLLRSLGYIPQFRALWPLIFLLTGLTFLHVTLVLKRGPESYVFIGMFFTLGGLFLLLMNTVLTAVGVEHIWPVFMTIVGLSLGAFGLRKRGYARLSLAIPALTIILLSFVFLPFSLGLVQQSFRSFVGQWWPTLFVLLGVALLIVHASRRHRG